MTVRQRFIPMNSKNELSETRVSTCFFGFFFCVFMYSARGEWYTIPDEISDFLVSSGETGSVYVCEATYISQNFCDEGEETCAWCGQLQSGLHLKKPPPL